MKENNEGLYDWELMLIADRCIKTRRSIGSCDGNCKKCNFCLDKYTKDPHKAQFNFTYALDRYNREECRRKKETRQVRDFIIFALGLVAIIIYIWRG